MIKLNSTGRRTSLLAFALVAASLTGLSPAPVSAQAENLRLTVQLIQADGFQDADPAIQGVVAQLRDLFRFEGYRLLAEATMTSGVPGPGVGAEVVGQRIAPSQDDRFGLEVFIERTQTEGVLRLNLRLTDARFEITSSTGRREGPDILNVGFNARENQTVVVGSSKYNPEKPTLIVAVRFERMEN